MASSQQAYVSVKEVGEDIHIQLSLHNTQDIIGLELDLSYDSETLGFVSADSSATGENALIQSNAVAVDHIGALLQVGIASARPRRGAATGEPLLTIKMRRETTPKNHLDQVASRGTIRVRLNERQIPVEIASVETKPIASLLLQNYPNPFNPETWIPYALKAESSVEIHIYNLVGQRIRTLNIGVQPASFYLSREKAAHWDGRTDSGERASNGVYFYVLSAFSAKLGGKGQRGDATDFTATRKMVILK